MKELVILTLTISVCGCSTCEPDNIELDYADSVEVSEPPNNGTSDPEPIAKVKKAYYLVLKDFDRSKFPHKKLAEFKGPLLPLASYPNFQDSVEDIHGVNAYYSDQSFCPDFDAFVVLIFEGGDCGPMLQLKTTNKVDSLISNVQLTLDCRWEHGSYSGYSIFKSDSTFTYYYEYKEHATDTSGEYVDYWIEGEKITDYLISCSTGEITIVGEEEIKK